MKLFWCQRILIFKMDVKINLRIITTIYAIDPKKAFTKKSIFQSFGFTRPFR